MSQPTIETATPVEPEPTETDQAVSEPAETDALVEQELLVEDVSIDGMCGVY